MNLNARITGVAAALALVAAACAGSVGERPVADGNRRRDMHLRRPDVDRPAPGPFG
jgi:hypothetical protein